MATKDGAVPVPADTRFEEHPAPARLPTPAIGSLAVRPEGAAEDTQVHGVLAAPVAGVRVKPEEFPLERCAEISASIACRRNDIAIILGKNDLDQAVWGKIEGHWMDAIKQETLRGKRELLNRFDLAYVAQLESERGPIDVGTYARIAVATERGTVAEALAEMSLPKGSLMRIERVWLAKISKDSQLRDRLGKAVEAARMA
jgi:hypothetical protein